MAAVRTSMTMNPGPQGTVGEGWLPVSDGHVIHWQQAGAPDGLPVLLLHGGPGSGHSQALARQVDPGLRAIGFDQRGCGLSTPQPGLAHNSTWHLVRDIEALRLHLGVTRWIVVGGSWGATLALAYAGRHPASVAGLVLRGLWVPTPAELDWFFHGAAALAPGAWSALAGLAPALRREALVPWLAEVFSGHDGALQARVARAWMGWEQALQGEAAEVPMEGEALQAAIQRYRVQSHYLQHGCWLGLEAGLQPWLQPQALRDIPVHFLHGTEDRVCRIGAAEAVHRQLPGSRFEAVRGAGHGPFHPAMAQALARWLARLAAAGEGVT